MSRRSTPSAKRDDDAFPIRIMLAVPPNGLGPLLDDMNAWLRTNLPRGAFAMHSARTVGGDAVGIYFIQIDDAGSFLAAFPGVTLALAERR